MTRANDQTSRRLPREKVRGLSRELKIGGEAKPDKKTRFMPDIPVISRPIPNPEKLSKHTINLKPQKSAPKSEPELPEIKQAATVKVNKKNGNTAKANKVGLGKTLVAKHNKPLVEETGLEHFKEGKSNSLRKQKLSIKFHYESKTDIQVRHFFILYSGGRKIPTRHSNLFYSIHCTFRSQFFMKSCHFWW